MKAMLTVLMIALAAPAQALDEQDFSDEYRACVNSLPELAGHWDYTKCLVDEAERQTAGADILFNNKAKYVDKRIRPAFKKAQIAWGAFIDAECGARMEAVAQAGGNGARDVVATCLAEHSILRQRQLQEDW